MKFNLINRIIYVITMSLLCLVNANAQESCKGLIKEAIREKVAIKEESLDVSFKISSWLTGLDSAIEQTSVIQEYDGITRLKTDELTILKKGNVTLNFLEKEKILRHSNKDRIDISTLIPSVFALYDSLLENGEIIKCFEICEKEETIHTITLVPNSDYQRHYFIQEMTFELKNGALNNMIVSYQKGQAIKKITLEIIKWETLNTPIKLTSRIVKVLEEPSKIKDHFPDYQLVQY